MEEEAQGIDVPPPVGATPPPIPEPEGLPEPPRVPDFEVPPPPPPPSSTPQYTPPQYTPPPVARKSRVVAGVLGLLFGSLGIHKFYLGYTNEGLIMAGITIVGGILSFGAVSGLVSAFGFVEGVIYLAKSDADFDATYVQGRKPWL